VTHRGARRRSLRARPARPEANPAPGLLDDRGLAQHKLARARDSGTMRTDGGGPGSNTNEGSNMDRDKLRWAATLALLFVLIITAILAKAGGL